MRVRLGRWNPGDPPSLTIEAETLDDTQILRAIADGSNTHRIALGCGYNCSPPAPGQLPGTVEVSLSWFKKDTPEAVMDALTDAALHGKGVIMTRIEPEKVYTTDRLDPTDHPD
jgi:hypothetical protein